jgi:hypothetical protein
LVTARQAAEEEGVTRKRLATKQYQGSVSYGSGPRLYTESHVAARSKSRMEPREKAGDREWSPQIWWLSIQYPSTVTKRVTILFRSNSVFKVLIHGAYPIMRDRQSLSYSRISKHLLKS